MKYKSATKMISARISEDNLSRLDDMSDRLGISKNELINEAVTQMYANHLINIQYRQYEAMGEDMTTWARQILKYHYAGKNLAVMQLHHP